MSVECTTHGIDLLYEDGEWQAPSYCSLCDLQRVRDAALQLFHSYEALLTTGKDEDEWDEYDHMMIPIWNNLAKALGGTVKELMDAVKKVGFPSG